VVIQCGSMARTVDSSSVWHDGVVRQAFTVIPLTPKAAVVAGYRYRIHGIDVKYFM